jgi:hypothetical protein
MTRGYGFSPQSYAFSPGLPFFGNAFNLFLQNPIVSMAICVLIFGVLWVPLYQLVAERYIGRQAALGSTLLFGLSPYTFLFTTVVYTEGLFLFFTLGSWHLFKGGKTAYASVFAAVSFLSRIAGVLLVLPMLFEALKDKAKHRVRIVGLSLVPILALFLLLVYFKITTNDFVPFLRVTEWDALYTVRTIILEGLPQKGISVFTASFQNYSAPLNWFVPFAVVLALAVPPFLIFKVAKTEKSLAVYSLTYYVGVLMGGALASTPRYISALFPLWIPLAAKLSLNGKSKILVVAFSAVSFIISLNMWVDFLSGNFVA